MLRSPCRAHLGRRLEPGGSRRVMWLPLGCLSFPPLCLVGKAVQIHRLRERGSQLHPCVFSSPTRLARTLWPRREHTGPLPQAPGPHAPCRALPGHTVVHLLVPLTQGPLNSRSLRGRTRGFSHRARSKFNYRNCLLSLGVRGCLCSASPGPEASRAAQKGPTVLPCFAVTILNCFILLSPNSGFTSGV